MVKSVLSAAAFFIAVALVQAVDYTVVQQGDYSGVKKSGYIVIRSQGQLDSFLKRHSGIVSAVYQGTDWKTTEYILVFAGKRSTTGYLVGIRNVTAVGQSDLVIDAHLTEPSPGGIVNPTFTTPYAAIRTAVHHGKLTLRWVP